MATEDQKISKICWSEPDSPQQTIQGWNQVQAPKTNASAKNVDIAPNWIPEAKSLVTPQEGNTLQNTMFRAKVTISYTVLPANNVTNSMWDKQNYV